MAPSAKSAERAQQLLHRDLELERRRQRRAAPRRPSRAWPARPRPARRRAARRRASASPASSSSAGATRLTSPIRSASVAADQLAGHDQLLGAAEPDDLRQPRGAADVGDQPDPRLGHADDRVRRRSRAGRRRARAPSRRRCRRRGSRRSTGLAISSARFQASRHRARGTRAGARASSASAAERAEVHAGGEHRARAAERRRSATAGSAAAARSASPTREHQLAVERVALLGAVEDDVADRAVLLGDDEGHCRERSSGSARAMSPRTPIGHDLLERLGALEAVDGPAKPIAKVVRERQGARQGQRGPAQRHLARPPAAPAADRRADGDVDSAVLLDWLGGEDAETAADLLIGAGLAGAVPTVATGYADWADTEPARRRRAPHRDRPRRLQRHRRPRCSPPRWPPARGGARGTGKLLALAGAGRARRRRLPRRPPHLRRGRRRRHDRVRGRPGGLDARRSPTPRWARARCSAVEVGGAAVLVARRGGERLRARRHLLAPRRLAGRGRARRRLRDVPAARQRASGSPTARVEQGPAAYPQPALEARVRDGSIEVRAAAVGYASGRLSRAPRPAAPAAAPRAADRGRRGAAHARDRARGAAARRQAPDRRPPADPRAGRGADLALGAAGRAARAAADAFQSVLLVCGLLLLCPALLTLADVLGADFGELPGRRVRVDLAASLARRRRALRARAIGALARSAR